MSSIRKIAWFQISRTGNQNPKTISNTGSKTTWTVFEWQPALEVIGVFLVFAAFAGVATPGINESHYLTKAKHFWNPNWCSGDLFLESADAHYVFFLTCGWPSLFLSLDTFAWLGRIMVWLGAAIAWVHLNRSFSIKNGLALMSAVLFVLLTEKFDMSGEWVIGGFEAKSVSYIFVIWATRLFVERQLIWFWPVLGAACAFHAVVGGWATVGFLLAIVAQAINKSSIEQPVLCRPSVAGFLSATLFAIFLLAGCVPPLLANSGVAPDIVATANGIQVHERLSHHLLFGVFPSRHIARFTLLVAIWLFATRIFSWPPRWNRFHLFCGSSLLITLGGLFLSGQAEQPGHNTEFANSMLRFYWFRFSDFAIPFGLSIVCASLAGAMISSATVSKKVAVVFSIVCLACAAVLSFVELHRDSRAGADRASLASYVGDERRTVETYENWKSVCRWVRENTPLESIFVTPTHHQTFKWYAHRAEVACWKDAPQDSERIIEWRQRIANLRAIELSGTSGILASNNDQIVQLANSYGVTHFLLPQAREDAAVKAGGKINESLIRIYPAGKTKRCTYVVYRIKEQERWR